MDQNFDLCIFIQILTFSQTCRLSEKSSRIEELEQNSTRLSETVENLKRDVSQRDEELARIRSESENISNSLKNAESASQSLEQTAHDLRNRVADLEKTYFLSIKFNSIVWVKHLTVSLKFERERHSPQTKRGATERAEIAGWCSETKRRRDQQSSKSSRFNFVQLESKFEFFSVFSCLRWDKC